MSTGVEITSANVFPRSILSYFPLIAPFKWICRRYGISTWYQLVSYDCFCMFITSHALKAHKNSYNVSVKYMQISETVTFSNAVDLEQICLYVCLADKKNCKISRQSINWSLIISKESAYLNQYFFEKIEKLDIKLIFFSPLSV